MSGLSVTRFNLKMEGLGWEYSGMEMGQCIIDES